MRTPPNHIAESQRAGSRDGHTRASPSQPPSAAPAASLRPLQLPQHPEQRARGNAAPAGSAAEQQRRRRRPPLFAANRLTAMDPWQPLEGDLDPELALALELDLLSDQDLLDAVGGCWPTGPGTGAGPAACDPALAAVPPPDLQLPPLPLVDPVAAVQQLPLPLWDTATLGLAGSWGGDAAAGEAAAAQAAAMAAAPVAAAHGGASSSAAGRLATPKKSGKSRSGSGVNRYDKPGARERKQEQQRNYRLRCKERAAEQQAQLAALGTAVEAARQQRQELLDEHAALQKMQEYKESVTQQLPLSDHLAATPAEGSSDASDTQAALPPPGSRAALIHEAAGGSSEGGSGNGSGSAETAGAAGGCGSSDGGSSCEGASSCEGGSSGSGSLGSQEGDWAAVLPTQWCSEGLSSGGLPPPAAHLMDAAVAMAEQQHSLPYDGCASGGGGLLSGMAAALLTVPDVMCRRLMRGIQPNQLTERERGFRNLIKAALEEVRG